MKKIVQINNSILRRTAKEIPVTEIRSPRIQKIICSMQDVLDLRSDGVGLAAPQIGESLRLFIVSRKIFAQESVNANRSQKKVATEDLVFINPKIIKSSRDKMKVAEGCLSVAWYFGETVRHKKMTVQAYDRAGNKFTYGGSGLMAQIFQHEIDHLNGILFVDHAKNLNKLTPAEIAEIEAENSLTSKEKF